MARKGKDRRYLAQLIVDENDRKPCAFCFQQADDEINFGKLYSIGEIQCHYFCCLLSCCLIQKGQDDEGLLGFMYPDILAEIERSKKHKCSYCNRNGATLGCAVTSCRKQFHLPCGRGKNAISLYYGNYKSFCQQHAPKQRIPEHIMLKARIRKKLDKNMLIKTKELSLKNDENNDECEEMVCVICYEEVDGFPCHNTFWPPCCARDAWFHRSCLQRMALSAGMHYLKCPLCNDKEQFYDAVVNQGYYVPDRDAAWELEQNAFAEIYERPVTCSSDVCACPMGREHDSENGEWDIKLCLLCGSAGAHAHCMILNKNPITLPNNPINPPINTLNTMENPINSPRDIPNCNEPVNMQNYASDQHNNPINGANNPINALNNSVNMPNNPINALNNPINASSNPINASNNPINASNNPINVPNDPITQSQRWEELSSKYFVCKCCMAAAPEDLSTLASKIETIIQREQATNAMNSRRPVMPSRMSLRRTKGKLILPTSARSNRSNQLENDSKATTTLQSSRLELNLKSPRKMSQESSVVIQYDSKMLSPFKLLEESFKEKVVCTGVRDAVLDENVIEKLRKKFRKPRPLSEKKRIVNDILDGMFDDLMKNTNKDKEQIREWCTPKKTTEIREIHELKTDINTIELQENNNIKTPTKINYNTIDTNINAIKEIESSNNDMEINDIKIKENDEVTKLNNSLTTKVSEVEENSINNEKSNKKPIKVCAKKTNRKKKPRRKSKWRRKVKKVKPEKKIEPDLSDVETEDTILRNLLLNGSKQINDNIVETPRRKTIDTLQNSSLEISETDQTIDINVIQFDQTHNSKLNVKLPDEKTIFKNKETPDVFDLERFKKEYLNEVDRLKSFKKLDFVSDADINEPRKDRKRKLSESLPYDAKKSKNTNKTTSQSEINSPENVKKKKVKNRSEKVKKNRADKKRKIKKKKNIELTIDSKNKAGKDKIKTKFAIHSNIKVKIKWKKKQLSLNIESNEARKKKEKLLRKKEKLLKKKEKSLKLKQYVLKFSEGSSKEVLVKPEKDVNLLKRKYVRHEKSPDKLKQMSIQNFFKVKSPTDESGKI